MIQYEYAVICVSTYVGLTFAGAFITLLNLLMVNFNQTGEELPFSKELLSARTMKRSKPCTDVADCEIFLQPNKLNLRVIG